MVVFVGKSQKDVTIRSEDHVTSVKGFWKTTDGGNDLDEGICTPRDILQGLVKEGFRVSYARIPLSREQIPKAKDLDIMRDSIQVAENGQKVVYMILSRSTAGSSTRFTASFIASYLNWKAPSE